MLYGPRAGLARALWGIEADAAFADAVDRLDLFATETGRTAIRQACAATGYWLPPGLPAADLAAELLFRRAIDPTIEPVVERAALRFARTVPSAPGFELIGRAARPTGDVDACLEALKTKLGRRFVDGFVTQDGASIHFALIRRGSQRGSTIVRHGVTRRIVNRRARVDTIRVDLDEGRIVIGVDNPKLARAYANIVGRALFDDATHFTDAVAFTLRVLVEMGSRELRAFRLPGITRVRIVDLTWDDGEGATFNVHTSDALATYEKRGGARSGYATSMMLRIDLVGVDHSIDVLIRLPDRIEIRSPAYEPEARAVLKALRLTSPGKIADDSYTLAPFLHAEWRWRRVLGDAAFEALRTMGALVAQKSRMVGGASMGKYGWSYIGFDVKSDPGKAYAVAMDPALPSRDLEPDEQLMWKLDLDVVRRTLSADLGTEPAQADAAIEGKALDLGTARGPDLDLRFFALLQSPGEHGRELAEAMVRAAGKAHVVVLLPEGRTFACGVSIGLGVAELFGAAKVAPKVFARVAEKKGLKTAVVEPWKLASPGTRFVAEAGSGRMWLDGHELRDLRESGARILMGTAKAGGETVRTKELATFVSPNRTDDGVIRQTIPKLGGWIRDSFVTSGKTPPEDADRIVALVKGRGWRMTVKCEVL